MKAKSIQRKTLTEIETALNNSMADGFTPTLALVFASIDVDRDGICSLFGKENIDIFGATTGGEFISGDIESGSAAILLLEIDHSRYRLLFDGENKNTRSAAKKLADQALEIFANPAFIVCGSGIEVDGELIIRGLEDAAGSDTTIYGGMAADDFKWEGTVVFTNQASSTQGIVLLALDGDRFDLRGRATCGWKPYGTEKTITKSKGWWIHTIDDRPAMDLIIKYIGLADSGGTGIELTSPKDAIDYPLLLYPKVGDPIIRPVLAINWDDRSVRVNGTVETGLKIRFSMPADFQVIDEVIQDCKIVQSSELEEADALIVFSCIGRLAGFGPLVGKEIEGIHKTYNVPLAGFFSYGEFGRAQNGNHEYHNLTCCWVAIKEKE